MADTWQPEETSTHQDHVIAHIVGATVLGYFVFAEALFVLLDIGFVWTVYVDGSMALLPHPVAIAELDVTDAVREEIKVDIDLLLNQGTAVEGLSRLTPAPVECLIVAVSFFSNHDQRRLFLEGEEAGLAIETSLSTGDVVVRSEQT